MQSLDGNVSRHTGNTWPVSEMPLSGVHTGGDGGGPRDGRQGEVVQAAAGRPEQGEEETGEGGEGRAEGGTGRQDAGDASHTLRPVPASHSQSRSRFCNPSCLQFCRGSLVQLDGPARRERCSVGRSYRGRRHPSTDLQTSAGVDDDPADVRVVSPGYGTGTGPQRGRALHGHGGHQASADLASGLETGAGHVVGPDGRDGSEVGHQLEDGLHAAAGPPGPGGHLLCRSGTSLHVPSGVLNDLIASNISSSVHCSLLTSNVSSQHAGDDDLSSTPPASPTSSTTVSTTASVSSNSSTTINLLASTSTLVSSNFRQQCQRTDIRILSKIGASTYFLAHQQPS